MVVGPHPQGPGQVQVRSTDPTRRALEGCRTRPTCTVRPNSQAARSRTALVGPAHSPQVPAPRSPLASLLFSPLPPTVCFFLVDLRPVVSEADLAQMLALLPTGPFHVVDHRRSQSNNSTCSTNTITASNPSSPASTLSLSNTTSPAMENALVSALRDRPPLSAVEMSMSMAMMLFPR